MTKRNTNLIRISIVVALVAIMALTASVVFGKDEGRKVTLEGEVLDLYCFMMHPKDGQGPGHAKCAMKCIKRGLPIGFLSDGEVYVLVGRDHESAKDVVVDFAGAQARLSGTLIEHHGVKAIEVEKIEKITEKS